MRGSYTITAFTFFLTVLAGQAGAQSLEVFTRSKGITDEQIRTLQNVQRSQSLEALSMAPLSAPMSKNLNLVIRADPRIVGGEPTTIQQNPWQVALIYGAVFAPEPVRQQFCGGSIIGSRWILTAAHCINGNASIERIDVVAGTTTYRYGGERIKVAQLFVHPNYDAGTQQNDIALIKLATPTTLGNAIPLPASGLDLPDKTNVTVSGWGAIYEGGPGSDILLWADLPVVADSECRSSYGNRFLPGMVCAGKREGGVDSCQGDSGGPLTTKIAVASTLVGIVSWGDGCARRLKYGLYTKVSAFRSWIDSIIQNNQ
jgi:secreted trypsin-like serine protease